MNVFFAYLGKHPLQSSIGISGTWYFLGSSTSIGDETGTGRLLIVILLHKGHALSCIYELENLYFCLLRNRNLSIYQRNVQRMFSKNVCKKCFQKMLEDRCIDLIGPVRVRRTFVDLCVYLINTCFGAASMRWPTNHHAFLRLIKSASTQTAKGT